MGKPYGMTAGFQIVKPTHIQDVIWNAIEEAQMVGMTVEEFRRECAEMWSMCLRERADDDAKSWEK
ncbi:MAG: hypothetical protein V3T23_01775 [Nitrososphaerales archaeon]